MNKIHNSLKDPLTGKIIVRVMPDYLESFLGLCKSERWLHECDKTPYPLPERPILQCYPVLIQNFDDEMKEAIHLWDQD
jgi:hypothetical protein